MTIARIIAADGGKVSEAAKHAVSLFCKEESGDYCACSGEYVCLKCHLLSVEDQLAEEFDRFAADTRERCALVVEDVNCGCGDNSAWLIRENNVPKYEETLIAKKVREAVAAEREACARVVETSYRLLTTKEFDEQTPTQARRQCAKLIRDRKDPAKSR